MEIHTTSFGKKQMPQQTTPIMGAAPTSAILVFSHGSLKNPSTPHLDEAWNVRHDGDAPLCRDHAELGVRIAAANP